MVDRNDAADRFWRFAMTVYPPPDARAAFLRLQDEGGADVPMVLWCLWGGAEGVRFSEDAMARGVSFSAAWRRERVEPVRALRRKWKEVSSNGLPPEAAEAARQAIAKAEQAIERLQMEHLSAIGEGEAGQADAARLNLALYERCAGLSLEDADRERVMTMVP